MHRKLASHPQKVQIDSYCWHGTVWGVNQNGEIYRRPVNGSGKWIQVPGWLNYMYVSPSGSGYTWRVTKDKSIHKCKQTCNGKWEGVDGKLSQVDGGDQFAYWPSSTNPLSSSGWQRKMAKPKEKQHNQVYHSHCEVKFIHLAWTTKYAIVKDPAWKAGGQNLVTTPDPYSSWWVGSLPHELL